MGVGIRPDKKEDTQLIRRFLLRIGAPDKKTVPVLSYSVFAYEKGGTFRARGSFYPSFTLHQCCYGGYCVYQDDITLCFGTINCIITPVINGLFAM